MPAFHSLANSDVKAVVAYLRVLQGINKTSALPGNPARGKTLFYGDAGCSACHMVAGNGGFIASDLSGYGSTHSVQETRNAITQPGQASDHQAQTAVVVVRTGQQYTGRIRNEDNFSLQLQSLDGTFHFFRKSDIERMEYKPLVAGEKQEIPFQGVYRLDANGNVRLVTKDLAQPNGLAFSPDGKHFYVDDSEKRNIRVYEVAANGTLENGKIFGEEPGEKDDGVPDGMKVDKNGNLFVTGPKGIWLWDAKGNKLGTIVMPEQPANLAWGDDDYGTLYITATTSMYRLRTKAHGYVPYSETP